jgi:hypothetical protein
LRKSRKILSSGGKRRASGDMYGLIAVAWF